MFWGLIVEPGKTYKQTVEKSFHVSMACLNPDKCKDTGYSSFILKTGGQEIVLCNLQKGSTNQVPLDLNFNAGDEIAFTTSGAKNTVHLSGYLIVDEDMDDEMFMGSDEEIDAADLKALTKKRKSLLDNAISGKIPKLDADDDDDDDDEDEEEEDDDDDDSSDDAMEKLEAIEEDDEDEDDSDEEEEVKPVVKPKENKTPVTPPAQTNGNAPESSKKKKKNKNKNNPDTNATTPTNNANTPKNNANTPKNNANTPNAQKTPKTPAPVTPAKKTLEGGVIIEEIRVGHGAPAKLGQNVRVYYTGRLKANNKQFDATNSGKPFGFRLGRGEVIKGWDVGVAGMQVGGKRKIIIPAPMAYGAKGAPPSIPPNAVLVFDVELKNLN